MTPINHILNLKTMILLIIILIQRKKVLCKVVLLVMNNNIKSILKDLDFLLMEL